jgi:UDP-N-acetylmuramoyl-L-alanyl-D-glutamate--2,6-diaminopimelate ligase
MYPAENLVESESRSLSSLLDALPEASIRGDVDVAVGGLAFDSRAVREGDLFFCVKGLTVDGHEYASNAVASGASAVVAERPVDTKGRPLVLVEDSRDAMARVSAAYYEHPSRQLKVIGITGTNGKTTTSYMIRAICESCGLKAGVLGTLGYSAPDFKESGGHTTPEAPVFQRLLRTMADDGVDCVAAEISSHALHLRRAAGTFFEVAVFTNLSRDHLDFHRTLEAYRDAKLRLFLPGGPWEGGSPRWAVLNSDDPVWGHFSKSTFAHRLTYGTGEGADVSAADVASDAEGSSFTLKHEGRSIPLRVKIPGRFNVHNALAACAAGIVLGCDDEALRSGIESVWSVPGRMERIECGQGFRIIVDYAHTPDALSSVLAALRPITPGKIICVFGCGGDRDHGKRSVMGAVVADGADRAVVTSDNPRSEDPMLIIDQILEGFSEAEREEYKVVPDRAEAIESAVRDARPGDTVLIAGKGHEDYQILGNKRIDFDDRAVAKSVLARMGHGCGSQGRD